MFRLEKVFQNDDSGLIYFATLIKTIFLFFLIYITAILQKNTVYDLFSFTVFKKTNYYFYSFFITLSYLFFSFLIKNKRFYKKNFISYLTEDISSLIISNILLFSILFIFQKQFSIDLNFLYMNLTIFLGMLIIHFYLNRVYQNLIDKNIIQKNVMLVGNYSEIRQVLKENFEKIYLFKCCIISDLKEQNKKIIKSEIKIPVFNIDEDIRSILEYHSLGQIWILNGNRKDKTEIFEKIINFSVDTLNIKLENTIDLKGGHL